MTQLAKVFELNRQGFNLGRGFSGLAIMLLPLIVLSVLHQEKYFLSMVFAVLFVGISDPGGEYGYRVPRMAGVAVAGALLTALGFGIGGGAWGLVVLAVFVITLLAGLAVKYGLHRFVAALLLSQRGSLEDQLRSAGPARCGPACAGMSLQG